MDFDSILSAYKSKACVMSVEKYPDGKYGNIRIAAGNKAHCDDMMNVMHNPFIPDSPYEKYLPQNRNFEDFCYRSAVLGQPLHSYVQLPQMGLWLNMFLLPLESDREDVGYCIYSYEVTPNVDSDQRASLSADTSAAVLKTCIKLRGSDNMDDTFKEVIEDIRQICDSDHCCILLVDTETHTCRTLCESIKPGSEMLPMDAYLDDLFFDITQTWKGTIDDSTCVIVKDENDMEWLKSVNPIWHESLTGAGAKNIVLFPLEYNGVTLGYLWALNFNVENTVKIKETLELTAFFIASEISNYQLLIRLEKLGSMDVLTGVKNRNAMNIVVSDVIDGKVQVKYPYTVVFADLNGLKKVNDQCGHDEGDNMLRRAAGILRDAFSDAEVYRAGGDEFMILGWGLDEEKLEDRLKKINLRAEDPDSLHFAIGTYVVHEGDDIRTAMRIADERMYINKKEYYDVYPERRYR